MAPKISGRLSQALLSNKIANVLSVFGTLVQAPSSKVKAEHEIVTKRGYVYTANNHQQKKVACTKPKQDVRLHLVLTTLVSTTARTLAKLSKFHVMVVMKHIQI